MLYSFQGSVAPYVLNIPGILSSLGFRFGCTVVNYSSVYAMLQLSLGISVTSLILIVTHFMQLLFLCYCYFGATSEVYFPVLIPLKC